VVNQHPITRQILYCSLLCIASVLVLAGCGATRPTFGDAAQKITFVNETDQPLQFYGQYSQGRLLKSVEVPPHSQDTDTAMITGPTFRIVAERPDGVRVFDQTYTWEELRQREGQVLVSSLDPIE